MSSIIKSIKNKQIACITITKPKRSNSLIIENWQELNKIIDGVINDNKHKVLMITGQGDHFVPEADSECTEGIRSDAGECVKIANEVFKKLEGSRLFTIAAINGSAQRLGCGLALACDIRIASESATFTYSGFDTVRDLSESELRLVRTVGLPFAKEMIATSDVVTARKALRIGLVNYVVDDEELIDFCLAFGKKVCRNNKEDISAGKRILNNYSDVIMLEKAVV